MAQLYWAFTSPERISGVRVAKVHKILHQKRPSLYPILDEHIKRLYSPCAAAWTERSRHLEGITAADSPPFWADRTQRAHTGSDEASPRRVPAPLAH
jgi:Family of unknown function (DUF6308)